MSDQPRNVFPLHALPPGVARVLLPSGATEVVIREEMLELVVGGESLITMRTPMGADADREWALGFLATEGVIQDRSEVRAISTTEHSDPSNPDNTWQRVQIELWRSSPAFGGKLSRAHEMRASCGLCGADPSALIADLPPLRDVGPHMTPTELADMVEHLRENQPLFALTGGCHGCGVFGRSEQGGFEAWAIREDVGRHNALDRAIGACLESGRRLGDGVAVLSGRSGYEMVLKCLRVGVAVIVSVGAPSELAVKLVAGAGATLVGFVDAKGGHVKRAHVYAGVERFRSAT